MFSANGDWPNLFRLFRHTSLIWRLRGEKRREVPFIADLTKVEHKATAPELARELAYFRARAAAALERQQAERPVLLGSEAATAKAASGGNSSADVEPSAAHPLGSDKAI